MVRGANWEPNYVTALMKAYYEVAGKDPKMSTQQLQARIAACYVTQCQAMGLPEEAPRDGQNLWTKVQDFKRAIVNKLQPAWNRALAGKEIPSGRQEADVIEAMIKILWEEHVAETAADARKRKEAADRKHIGARVYDPERKDWGTVMSKGTTLEKASVKMDAGGAPLEQTQDTITKWIELSEDIPDQRTLELGVPKKRHSEDATVMKPGWRPLVFAAWKELGPLGMKLKFIAEPLSTGPVDASVSERKLEGRSACRAELKKRSLLEDDEKRSKKQKSLEMVAAAADRMKVLKTQKDARDAILANITAARAEYDMESDDEAKTVLKKAVKAFRAELEALNAPAPAVEAPVALAPVDMFAGVEPDAAAEVESAERDAELEVESDVEGTPPKAPRAPSKKATKPKVARKYPDFDDAESQAAADRALRQRNDIHTD